MVGRLLLLAGAAMAQNARPWNRLGERLGLRADTPIPKPLSDAIAAARNLVPKSAPTGDAANATAPPAVGGTVDPNGCALGGGYQWCEEKKKCLRQWEEPCTATIPVCTTGEIICTAAMQQQGMNCVVGACVKSPGSLSAMAGAKDANGCVSGGGYTWCDAKAKCLRLWEEPCEAPATPVTPTTPVTPAAPTACAVAGEVMCTSAMQKQGMNCVVGKCVKAPAAGPQISAMARGGARDVNGCILGGGYSWCASKSKCLREWEEPCVDTPAVVHPPAMGGARDANGCVTGGGYSWCEGKKKCLRQWEEPCEAPVELTQTELIPGVIGTQDDQVAAPPAVGASKDTHGCALGGGYQWCDSKQKCLRQWEEPCENAAAPAPKPWMSKIVDNLSPEDKAKVEKLMNGFVARQAQLKSTVQQKMQEFKNGDVLASKFGSLKDRLRNWADARKPAASVGELKIGAHEDHRVSGTNKDDGVANGVL